MLQKMRTHSESFAFKVLLGMIVVALSVFGFGALNLFSGTDPEMAKVDGEKITQGMVAVEVERERRRLAAQLGDKFDPAMIDPVRLQGTVVEQMITRMLLRHGAEDLGLGTSDASVAATIRRNPNFEVDGQFQEGRFRLIAQGLGYSGQGFVDETRELLTLEQLQTGLGNSALQTDQDLRDYARLLGQRRDVAYLPFTVEKFSAQVTVTDDDVAARYEENRLDYMTEESVDVDLVELKADALLSDPSIQISEDAVRQAYEADRAAAPSGEERRSRHILLTLSDQRDAAAAEAEIKSLQARIAAGESFADLAKEVSEDPGSAPQGGELGFAGHGVYDPEFEKALFALDKPGALSGPVATQFGYHLIQLEEVRQVDFPAFEIARAGIEERLRRQQADTLFKERVRELDNLAFERPNDLEGISGELGLEVRRVQAVTRAKGDAPFDVETLRKAVFAPEVLEQGFNSAAVEYEPGRAVVARVAVRHTAEPIPLDQVADKLRAQLVAERAGLLADEARAAAQQRVAGGEPVAEVAIAYGLEWQRFEAVRRGAEEVPREVLDVAFRLDRPAEGGKSVGEADLAGGGTAVVTVTRVQDGTLDGMSETEVTGLRQLVANRVARLDFDGFYQTLQKEASIRRPE